MEYDKTRTYKTEDIYYVKVFMCRYLVAELIGQNDDEC